MMLRNKLMSVCVGPLPEYTRKEKAEWLNPDQTLELTTVPLFAALKRHDIKIVEYLLARGADPAYMEKIQNRRQGIFRRHLGT